MVGGFAGSYPVPPPTIDSDTTPLSSIVDSTIPPVPPPPVILTEGAVL